MESSLKKRLERTLNEIDKSNIARYHVVMLPDFFVDHFVSLNNVEKVCQAVKTSERQGGGNLPGISQQICHGGNAANTALALARLGVSSHLICRTDPLGLDLLQFFLGKHNVDLSGVKTDGKLAITAALEFQDTHANVMMGDTGSVADFSFDVLNAHDKECIAAADIVGVVDWNQNLKGTVLAKEIFDLVKQNGAKTFFDSGDPSSRVHDIPELLSSVLKNSLLDIFGLNENELRYYSNSSGSSQEELLRAVSHLKTQVPARIDLHTSGFSCTICNAPVVVPTISLQTIYRSTGAGDAWNAANLFGELHGFEADERLLFANVAAGLYISSSRPVHATFDVILNFIKNFL